MRRLRQPNPRGGAYLAACTTKNGPSGRPERHPQPARPRRLPDRRRTSHPLADDVSLGLSRPARRGRPVHCQRPHGPPARPPVALAARQLRASPGRLRQLVHALLSACPDLHVLATSREALGITGEIAWRVPSLPVPDLQHLPPLTELQ